MTGFRLARGGAQEAFGVRADIVCMGKILGGGLPLAAFGGSFELMQNLSPVGSVYQAGTLSGNPLAVAAGQATLELLGQPGVYDRLEAIGAGLEQRLAPHLQRHGLTMARVGSMMTVFFRSELPHHFEQVKECDLGGFGRWHRACLDRGIYLPCSQFEAVFLPATLSDAELDRVASAMGDAFDAVMA
jgi:glutamate-1-semialdehyde 2,1-aminomutase